MNRRIRRPVELVAVVMDHRGTSGLAVAVTIATPEDGMVRKVFGCGPTPRELVQAIRQMADWLEREYDDSTRNS